MAAEVALKFGDGEYLFALRLPQILELQRLCGAGIFAIYGRVLKGRYRTPEGIEFGVPGECDAFVGDLYEVIRLALAGGGKGRVNGEDVEVSPLRAKELVETYCHGRPLVEVWNFAAAALLATIEGYDDQKKSPAPGGESPRKASTKRKSSQTAQ